MQFGRGNGEDFWTWCVECVNFYFLANENKMKLESNVRRVGKTIEKQQAELTSKI